MLCLSNGLDRSIIQIVMEPLFVDELVVKADRLVRSKATTTAQLEAFSDKLTRITAV